MPLSVLMLLLPLQIIPMWDSLNMRTVGVWPFGALGWHQVVDDSFLYVKSGKGLVVFDISDPASPTKLDSFKFGASFHTQVGNTLCGVGSNRGVTLVDVTRPESPTLIGYHLTPDITISLCAQDSLLYVAAYGAGLRIINISDPGQPKEIGAWMSPASHTHWVTLRENFAFLADGYAGLRILDVSNPHSPGEVFWHRIGNEVATSIALADTIALIAWRNAGLRLWNVADPTQPYELGVLPSYAKQVAVKDSFAFVILWTGAADTMLILDIADPTQPRPVAGLPAGFFLKLWNDLCFVSNPENVRTEDSLYILSVQDPTRPVSLGVCTGFHGHFDILHVAGGLGFGGTRGQGVQVFDVSSPAEPTLISQIGDWYVPQLASVGNLLHLACVLGPPPYRVVDVTDPRNPVLVGTQDSMFSGGAVAARDSLVFLIVFDLSQTWQLWILSAADPTQPRVLSRIPAGPGRQFRACVVDGNLLYIAAGSDGLRVLDISDPVLPEPLGACSTMGSAQELKTRYPYAYIADGLGGITVVDISDPSKPFMVGNHPTPYGTFSIDLDRNIAYVADGFWGVRAFDVSNPAEPSPVGFYHTPCFAQYVQVMDGLVFVADGRGWLVLERYPPGVEEPPNERPSFAPPGPTVVRGVLNLSGAEHNPILPGESGLCPKPTQLLNATGRRVMDLQPGENDVRHLAPGVYFIRAEGPRGQGFKGSSRKVVIQR
ncbi:MAG TPA: hypothetical protein ENN51_06635 [candidate division WOR-3 bacterium]|uniref:Choice-of-anchor B family protein n=1 Tax=candidate division WOR-3 bacterium TaxID=2052148 RepID=A0A7V0T696_UNCW3|nr:hypothetical protein [candidate division WOR-3 bacterium]